MKEIQGDLIKLALEDEFDVIVHGCNCFHTFGAGIAKQIKQTWPEVYEEDKKTEYGAVYKMGSISYAEVSPSLIVVNAYTQFGYGGDGPLVSHISIGVAFQNIKREFGNLGFRFGIPKIGAGLAGGDWKEIAPFIEEAMKGEDLTLAVLP